MPELTATEKIGLIRLINRPTVNDYIPMIFQNFTELHGDRHYGDDKAIMAGIATINSIPVTVIAQVKGRNIEENKRFNFAMPHPEGYRKALRLAEQAEKFHRPIICLIDTPGAFCGIEAEERGQGEAIAKNLIRFMQLKTPVISIVLGEAGSGGALALGVCDELFMLENAVYSVISPRGFASILWKDPSREFEAAELMKITAQDLMRFGICDQIIPEPLGGAHTDPQFVAMHIAESIYDSILGLTAMDTELLLRKRYEKFRKIGYFSED